MPLTLGGILLTASVGLTTAAAAADKGADTGHLYDVRGVKLYTEISGSGPPVVFLHGGLSFFNRAFTHQKAYFSTFRTVIGIDQRGHGHSPDDSRPFSYREMADDTAALVRKLGLGPVDVVGHSDGANVALLLARYYPQLVRRVVVSGANVNGYSNGIITYARLRWMSDREFAAGMSEDLRRDYAAVSPDGDRHWSTVVAKTKELWSTWLILSPADLGAIQAPVLVMAGDHDAISLEHTIKIYRDLPKGELCILPGTGHETMRERPEDFNRVTREFLEKPDPR